MSLEIPVEEQPFLCDDTKEHADVVDQVRRQMYPEELNEKAAAFFKIFGDGTRIKIIWAIDRHEMCVCDIAEILGMTKSAISHQLALLRGADLVRCRREGREVYYSLADSHVCQILESGFEHIQEK